MTKQEKIKEAWGECWNKLPNEVQEKAFKNNGFVSQYFEHLLNIDKRERKFFKTRPKSLQGIENNNGWIKIESEEQRFPDEDLWICNFNGNKQPFIHDAYEFIPERYTHYQPIEKPQPPIY